MSIKVGTLVSKIMIHTMTYLYIVGIVCIGRYSVGLVQAFWIELVVLFSGLVLVARTHASGIQRRPT